MTELEKALAQALDSLQQEFTTSLAECSKQQEMLSSAFSTTVENYKLMRKENLNLQQQIEQLARQVEQLAEQVIQQNKLLTS